MFKHPRFLFYFLMFASSKPYPFFLSSAFNQNNQTPAKGYQSPADALPRTLL